jgi:hypothetical protein
LIPFSHLQSIISTIKHQHHVILFFDRALITAHEDYDEPSNVFHETATTTTDEPPSLPSTIISMASRRCNTFPPRPRLSEEPHEDGKNHNSP